MTSPMTEVMPRTGRGTQANTDAGNTQPLEGESFAPTRWRFATIE
jgi:hypothetical protein